MILNNPELPSIQEFKDCPVWIESASGKYLPVTNFPRADADGCLVATALTLKDGSQVFGILSMISCHSTLLTKIGLRLFVVKGNEMFEFVRRYAESSGPMKLVEFLGLSVDDVFPIFYDLSNHLSGEPGALRSAIGFDEDPEVKMLSSVERAKIIVADIAGRPNKS